RIYEEADEILGFSISKLSFEGDADVLTETRNAQPAILLHSLAVAHVMKDEAGLEPSIAAGHSLGEYSALAAAGTLDDMDALRIVRRRGELMFDAGLRQPGTMAAIIGMETADVQVVCEEASTGDTVVVLANINSPGQVVVSGHIEAVERAMKLAEGKGVRKVVRLNVSGAFHSPLVAPAQDELVEYIKSFEIKDTTADVVCNADAKIVTRREQIIDALSRQLTSPVKWSDSMNLLTSQWGGEILEVGPGKVLSGLMKRIDRARSVETVGTADQLAQVIERETVA
ncbi:MAG: ACP S-malonyltransferase, partial [Candidatus Krumholzibacteria bacterium]|nr:ACP S-malonyltransferase [Candidatus Krumholzibacteria bacterium]